VVRAGCYMYLLTSQPTRSKVQYVHVYVRPYVDVYVYGSYMPVGLL